MKTTELKTEKLKALPENALLIGRGVLTWAKSERVSDRYGSVWLMADGSTSLSSTWTPTQMWFPPEGQSGTLIAKVTDPRDSTHVGDFFRGIGPRKPKSGDILVLGRGKAFTQSGHNGETYFGVEPDDGRKSDWLNPRALYDCHESIVELIWSEGGAA